MLTKRLVALLMVLLISIENFAAVVSDNDGSAFITKAEFDSLKNDFQSQIDQYNTSIDSKIDGAIASYLAGIKLAVTEVRNIEALSIPNDGYIYSLMSKDLGMSAGVPDLNITLTFSSGMTPWDSVSLAFKTGGLTISKVKNDIKEYSNRLYIKKHNNKNVFDGYWAVNDNFSGIWCVSKINFDLGYGSEPQNMAVFVWCSHNTPMREMSLKDWWSNVYTTWGEPGWTGTSDWASYWAPTYHSITQQQIRTNYVYRGIIVTDTDMINTYPSWNDASLSNVFIQPSYVSQNDLRTRLVAKTMETIWDGANGIVSWSVAGRSQPNRVFAEKMAKAKSDTAPNRNGYKDYHDSIICLRKPDYITIGDLLQNDLRSLEYTDDTGKKQVLSEYKLTDGIPITAMNANDVFKWKPNFIKSDDGSAANIDPTFYYVTNTDRTVVSNVTKTSSGEYEFTSNKGALVFAKWMNGYALDINSSRTVHITKQS